MQAALGETRRTEWNKWMKFNAGVTLTDEEVRRLTEAGGEIYPMKRVDTDKRVSATRQRLCTHSRGDNDYVSVLTKYKSRLVGCGKTTEGPRTDSPAVDVESHNIVRSWCDQAHVSIHSCDFTNVFQLKVSQKKVLQAEKCRPHVFPSTVQRMQDEDCGFD